MRFIAIMFCAGFILPFDSLLAQNAGDPATRPQNLGYSIDFLMRIENPYEELGSGFGVYRGELVSFSATTSGDSDLENGVAVIKVSQVISGPKADTLRLPYSIVRRRPPGLRTPRTRWPNLSDASPHQSLLCIVSPILKESFAQDIPGVDGDAMEVYFISGADDPNVKAFERMVELLGMEKTKLAEDLKQTIIDPNPLLQKFSAEAAWRKLDVRTAIPLLRNQIAPPKGAPAIFDHGLKALDQLAIYLETPKIDMDERSQCIAGMADGACSSDPRTKEYAFQLFSQLISGQIIGPADKSLSQAKRKEITENCRTVLSTKNSQILKEAEIIANWISDSSTTPATLPVR